MIVSGGFAVVQPDSQLSVNAVEGFPLEQFSSDVCSARKSPHRPIEEYTDTGQSVKGQLAEAQRVAGGGGSEQDIAEAKIELEVCSAARLPVIY